MPVKETVVTEVSVTPQSAAPVAAPAKRVGGGSKRSGSGKSGGSGSMDLQSVMSLIQEAALSKDETQMLVEMILARPAEDSWTTKV